jgi:hypothetical protein
MTTILLLLIVPATAGILLLAERVTRFRGRVWTGGSDSHPGSMTDDDD